MSILITARVPGTDPATVRLSGVQPWPGTEPGTTELLLDTSAACELLEAWAEAAPYRGFTAPDYPDHDWSWIYGEPVGDGLTRLALLSWDAVGDRLRDAPRDRWSLSDFDVAVEIVDSTSG